MHVQHNLFWVCHKHNSLPLGPILGTLGNFHISTNLELLFSIIECWFGLILVLTLGLRSAFDPWPSPSWRQSICTLRWCWSHPDTCLELPNHRVPENVLNKNNTPWATNVVRLYEISIENIVIFIIFTHQKGSLSKYQMRVIGTIYYATL